MIFFGALLFSGILYAAQGNLLAIVDGVGKQVFSMPISSDTCFAIRYKHSVALTPVIDYFLIKDGKLVLDKTEYKDFGAGLPHMPETGQIMRQQDGWLSITGLDRILPEFTVRVGRVASHELLLFADKEIREAIPLENLAKPGQPLTFKIIPSQ